jgi:hypothetical protein
MTAYQVTKWNLQDLQKNIRKSGLHFFYGTGDLEDESKIDEATVKSLMKQFSSKLDLEHIGEMVSAANMPNTRRSLLCYGWMDWFFNIVGDKMPNSKEIHLEPITYQEVHREYEMTMESYFPDEEGLALNYTSFLSMWHNSFAHVKIREYKQVSGKCTTCATLSDLRRKYKSANIRQAVTDLHALHRITYMGERMNYYRKQWLAIMHPEMYMSIILDGMAQKHTALPYLANQKDFPAQLTMHLQGVIEHGQKFVS